MVEDNQNKKSKGLIVVLIILILLVLGLSSYIVYDKVLKEESKEELKKVEAEETKKEEELQEIEELVVGNTFNLNDIRCEDNSATSCVKTVKLSYNNKNHEVKLIKKLTGENNYSIEVYIDNVIVDNLNGGRFYDWGENETSYDWVKLLDGYIYVIDGKYLGIVYRHDDAKPSWFLKFYNETKPFSNANDIKVANSGSSLGINGKTLTDLESLEFDGKSIKYWDEYCGNDIKPDRNRAVAQQHSLTFDGTNIKDVIVQTIKNAQGGGQSSC